MRQSVRSKAEEKFAAAQKKFNAVQSENEKERQAIAQRTERLRALRLAKEAAEAADVAASGDPKIAPPKG